MKKFNLVSGLIGFFAALIICIVIVIIIWPKHPCENKCPIDTKMLTIEQVRSYYGNYMHSAKPFNDTITAYTINKDQILIMNSLVAKDSSLYGCRIYRGINASKETIGIIMGYDINFANNQKQFYCSKSPCPPICDSRGPCPPVCEPK